MLIEDLSFELVHSSRKSCSLDGKDFSCSHHPMEDAIKLRDWETSWEVTAETQGAEVVEYFWGADEALNYCARVFFANTLFDAAKITIRYSKFHSPLTLGDRFPANLTPKGSWLVKTLVADKIHCRWFRDLESVFDWLHTELHAPTTGIIQIWDAEFVAPDNDPDLGTEPAEFPFA